MKQGTGHSQMSAQKHEPIVRSISPGAVSEIGIHEVRTQPNPLVDGRGFMAPPLAAHTTHHCGSQGKHSK